MLSFLSEGNNLLLELGPETLADGLFMFGWACMALAKIIAAVLAIDVYLHLRCPDPVEEQIRTLQAEYEERRRKHHAVFDVTAEIGALRHNQLRKEVGGG